MDQPLYPSSAVKIMTCLVALENSSLDEQITMTETGVAEVTDGSANISSQLGEVFTMEQCLYAIMVGSANDIALQVAEHVSGSVEAFVQKMNEKAKEVGCKDTVFTNPTGLPDETNTQLPTILRVSQGQPCKTKHSVPLPPLLPTPFLPPTFPEGTGYLQAISP